MRLVVRKAEPSLLPSSAVQDYAQQAPRERVRALAIQRTASFLLDRDNRVHPALRILEGELSVGVLRSLTSFARQHRTCPFVEAVCRGAVDEEVLYRNVARWLDRPYGGTQELKGARVLQTDGVLPRSDARLVRVRLMDGRIRSIHAPSASEACHVRDRRVRQDLTAERVIEGDLADDRQDGPMIATPSCVHELIASARGDLAIHEAIDGLAEREPEASARRVLHGPQGLVLVSLFAIGALAVGLAPVATLSVLHVALTVLFLGCVALRVFAASVAQPPRYGALPDLEDGELPIYTVLVALHREAAVVPQLIAHLDRLRWPRAKLDIQLVCEADDTETIRAIDAHGLPAHMRVVMTPAGGPRTKPKALNYALDRAKGELLVLYDAEDRPHPCQLLEAYGAFRDGDRRLACLQAPLQVDNGKASFFARGFALEYAALFRGLLPWLAKHGLPLPLGGTSNHFRVDALRAVGAWDPYNVTEDADLGFRLASGGYRTSVLTRPTLEAAPLTYRVWLPQRTRWLKGWLQTWLVQMRRPVLLRRTVGWGGFVTLQILMAGMVASALFHPLMLLTLPALLALLVAGVVPSTLGAALLAFDLANIVLGYGAFWLLARAVLRQRERWLARGSWWRLPLYWLSLCPAGWRAVWQLWRTPHKWEKTPHLPSVQTL